jgi:Protein of unknown function (DUF2793)
MSEPVTFPSATPNIGLPLLLAGQTQKEFFVNQALGILDALHSRTVLASRPAPPPIAAEGDCYRVTAPAGQAWEGCENHLAIQIGGAWHFVAPLEGMSVFDAETGNALVYRESWQRAAAPAVPAGGAFIDAEARATIAQLIQTLQAIGVLA